MLFEIVESHLKQRLLKAAFNCLSSATKGATISFQIDYF